MGGLIYQQLIRSTDSHSAKLQEHLKKGEAYTMHKFLPLVLIYILLSACDTQGVPEANTAPPIQTDAAEYILRANAQVLATEIPYRFENKTGNAVYLVNCNGAFDLYLERYTRGTWEVMWSPFRNLCLDLPIIIAAGEAFTDTLHVVAGYPDSNLLPQFQDDNPAGLYRIVWGAALSSYNEDNFPFGTDLPFEQRISNTFLLHAQYDRRE